MKKENNKTKIKKEDFISFLSHMTPEEIGRYINEKGKPAKLIDAFTFYDESKNKKDMKS